MRIDEYGFAKSGTANFANADTSATARKYHDRGWAVTPVGFRTKEPILKGWPKTRLTIDDLDSHFKAGATNIGVVLGELSNGLVDVDIDDPEAIPFAGHFLPDTDCVAARQVREATAFIKSPHPADTWDSMLPVSPSWNCEGMVISQCSPAPSIHPGNPSNLTTAVTVIQAYRIGLNSTVLRLRPLPPPFSVKVG
jgi:bifunctional DNA primase/polymerase-like protein